MTKKVDMDLDKILEVVILGIKNGNYDAAIAICEEVIAQVRMREVSRNVELQSNRNSG